MDVVEDVFAAGGAAIIVFCTGVSCGEPPPVSSVLISVLPWAHKWQLAINEAKLMVSVLKKSQRNIFWAGWRRAPQQSKYEDCGYLHLYFLLF